MYFMSEGMKNPNNALAGSNDFMHLFGHVCLGLMWARMAETSLRALAEATEDPGVPRNQARHGAVLHGPRSADHRHASCADPVRR